MPHAMPLITTISVALALALMLGVVAWSLKLPVLVGYLIAGVLIGPYTPGFVGNMEISKELAEIGIMLLMFGVGLHFSLTDFLSVRRIVLPGTVLQMIVTTALGYGLAVYWKWNHGSAFIFGLSLSVASTVVLLRTLEAQGILESINGRIAISWLIIEDLLMVLILVLIPPLSDSWVGATMESVKGNVWLALVTVLIKMAVFILFMIIVGRKFFPKLLCYIARTGSRELFTLCVVAAAVSIAYAAATLFGVSFAVGAFFFRYHYA